MSRRVVRNTDGLRFRICAALALSPGSRLTLSLRLRPSFPNEGIVRHMDECLECVL